MSPNFARVSAQPKFARRAAQLNPNGLNCACRVNPGRISIAKFGMKFLLRPQDKNLVKEVFSFAGKRKTGLYLVGGYLRDIALKREKENPDIDFCVEKNSISFGRAFSKRLKAGFVVLDKKHGSCRLVKKIKDKTYTLDFTDFRGKDLNGDLLHRDFTINAMALDLKNNVLIDPARGKEDLDLGLLRAVSKDAFDEDPLRILRAFSLSAIFGFRIDKGTLRLIRQKKDKLSAVAQERIRDELFKILNTPFAFKYFLELDKLKILRIIIPEIEVMRNVKQGPYHHLDILRHSMESLRQLEILFKELERKKDIRNYLDEQFCPQRSRRALIKLGAFLHDIGKPCALRREGRKITFHGHERIGAEIAVKVARRLRLSNDEIDSLEKMVFWHLRPGYLADNEEVTARATFRYFRDTAQEAVSVLLISVADQRSTKGPLTTKTSRVRHEEVVFNLMKEYFRRRKERKIIRLINGDDLIKKFGLTPSPLIGKILSEIEELQAIGKVKTRKEALRAARNIF